MAEDWAGLAEGWRAAGHEVEAVDLWEFQVNGGVSFEEFASAFNARVRKVGGEHQLVGYSLGGRLALHAMLDDGELWQGAVLVGAHPGLSDEGARIARMGQDAEWAAMALTAPWEQFVAEWNTQGVLRPQEELTRWADRSALEEKRQSVLLSFMHWSLGKQADLRPRLKDLKCPTLWVTGSEDEKFGPLAAEGAGLSPGGASCVVEGAGHRVPWEKAEEFGAKVVQFIGDA